ncbi:hypothetical protein E2C01_049252 [Portunus trituberculatus]|uniref:Uncharacterized protein n=1 Tax=Portunus trituberculatus TaxID=210409 RepID=A0A5B7G546_PORTR|nr:hypothetical protein [Portunus trituberculatus]
MLLMTASRVHYHHRGPPEASERRLKWQRARVWLVYGVEVSLELHSRELDQGGTLCSSTTCLSRPPPRHGDARALLALLSEKNKWRDCLVCNINTLVLVLFLRIMLLLLLLLLLLQSPAALRLSHVPGLSRHASGPSFS